MVQHLPTRQDGDGVSIRPDEKPISAPLETDGVTFFPTLGDGELVYREGVQIGELGIDEIWNTWQARKGVCDWKPMRCRAEARAFLASNIKQ